MLLKCECVHEFQDRKYGVGMRVHNTMNNGKPLAGTTTKQYRCTVCGRVRTGKDET
jgi:hypothetical protein